MKPVLSILLLFIILTCLRCSNQLEEADITAFNGKVYTVDSLLSVKESFAVKDGKFLYVGSNKTIREKYIGKQIIDLQGKHVFPGLIDAHCHFYSYGMNLKNIDLVGTKSFEEIIGLLKNHYKKFPAEWILGRGWDQNDWEPKEFPNKNELDKAFPDVPVFLKRIDGHAAIANSEALTRAGITGSTKVTGGELIMENGELTGVLIDNAIGLIGKVIPKINSDDMVSGLMKAQKNCFKVGLTTVFDAGLDKSIIELIDSLHKENPLKISINAMISPTKENFEKYLFTGIFQTDHLTVRSVKLFADGALGSRGAKLIAPYSDDPGNTGLLVSEPDHLKSICEQAYKYGFQVNTHCIGDSANRLILTIYSEILKGENDRRWRIEHAQVIHPDDFQLFAKYNIIPSVQSTHATSDMYWAEDRLGPERIKGAYAFHQLLEQNGWLANGSDFPVENINPLYGYYAAITRKDLSGYPDGGFQMGNALSREEALKAMTIWAAKSGFEENRIGSIEPGKYADFIILKENLMECELKKIPDIRIQKTYIRGDEVYSGN